MTRLGLTLILCFALSACGLLSTPTTAITPKATPSPTLGPGFFNLTVDGVQRTYLLHRPQQLDRQRSVPLVIALHGFTQSVQGLQVRTQFDQLADKDGFVVVYPAGLGASWNAGSCCGYAVTHSVDDVAFIDQLIDRLTREENVDPKRVYAAGLSNGGFMAHRLACDLASKIDAIASIAGSLLAPCHPTRPISILEMHGSDDSIVPLNGGTLFGLVTFPPTSSVMTQWVALDGCGASPTVTQSGVMQASTWSGCHGGSLVVLDVITGGQHGWFGGFGGAAGEPDATQAAWDFFSHSPPLG